MKFFKHFFIFFSLSFFSVNSQILFSEYAEGTSYNKYLEIYNYSNETIDLTNYAFPSCSNGCDMIGEWDYMNLFPEGATLNSGDVYIIVHPNAANPENEYYTAEIALYSDYTFNYLSNGDDIFALINIETGNIIDVIGDFASGEDPGSGFDVAGVTNATKDHTLVRKSSVLTGNNGDWVASAGTNSDDSEWIVLDNEVWDNLGFHDYDNNPATILGCMDSDACNFNPLATQDNGTCEYIVDCSGECGGSAYFDGCGTCDSDPLNDCLQPVTGCYWCEFAANYFDFSYQITSSNMTIMLPAFDDLMIGDVIGLFYVNQDGYLGCGGAVDFAGEQMAIAAWSDDPTTPVIDGFQSGDSFIFLVLRDGVVHETTAILNQEMPFTNVYGPNDFGQVIEFSITGEFIEECILPLDVSSDCGEMSILEDIRIDKKLLIATDILGRAIKPLNTPGLHFINYNDGTVEKKYFLNH